MKLTRGTISFPLPDRLQGRGQEISGAAESRYGPWLRQLKPIRERLTYADIVEIPAAFLPDALGVRWSGWRP
ncbi:MAG: hypothetical protein HOQ35_14105 [Acidobacteriaceae bacterium]|nr:hypothetical protein [Acidobacteriaceae bacterium]